ncbi:hypothetical protein RhoFasSB10_05165 [Rhodococcus fascians]|nr:hypothetical protein [Rhodococcus fascians]
MVSLVGVVLRPVMMTVGVPWPGIYAPEVSMMSLRSTVGRNSSMSLVPNSRFMKELEVICPTQPAGERLSRPSRARRKKSSMNGTVRAYWRWVVV